MYYYVNQKEYPHVLYPTCVGVPELERLDTTISNSGCGVCSASMVVTNLTGQEFSLAQSLELSMAVGANHSPGTDMDLFAPYVAERFGLDLVVSDDPALVRKLLSDGYIAIANIAGDRPEDNWVGLFSHGGHYVVVVDIDEDTDTVTVLDPSQFPDKYREEGRLGKVVENGNILHVAFDTLYEDCRSRNTANYEDGSFKRWLEYAGKHDSENHFFLFGLL